MQAALQLCQRLQRLRHSIVYMQQNYQKKYSATPVQLSSRKIRAGQWARHFLDLRQSVTN